MTRIPHRHRMQNFWSFLVTLERTKKTTKTREVSLAGLRRNFVIQLRGKVLDSKGIKEKGAVTQEN